MVRYPGKKSGIAVIPTLLTLGNSFCGFVAIAKTMDALMIGGGPLFEEKMVQAAWLIFLAMVFDALDGRVARMTNQTSEFGAQLDSFNDLISFGVAPALLVKAIYEQNLVQADISYSVKLTLLLTALYTICAVLRLARFTVETTPEDEAHNSFAGFPTPAAAGMIASMVLFIYHGAETFAFMNTPVVVFTVKKSLLFIPPFLGLLMISKLEYTHLFNRFLRGRKTFNFLVQGVLALFVIAFCHEWALLLCFTLYLFSGPVLFLIRSVEGLWKGKEKDKDKKQAPPQKEE